MHSACYVDIVNIRPPDGRYFPRVVVDAVEVFALKPCEVWSSAVTVSKGIAIRAAGRGCTELSERT